MNSHFSEDTLRANLEQLAKRPTVDDRVADFGRDGSAEVRFDTDHTVQQLAYLAHLTRASTN